MKMVLDAKNETRGNAKVFMRFTEYVAPTTGPTPNPTPAGPGPMGPMGPAKQDGMTIEGHFTKADAAGYTVGNVYEFPTVMVQTTA